MADQFGLKDKVILVTGAGGSLGRATALELAAHGAKVILVDLSESLLEPVLSEIQTLGGKAHAFVGDVTEEASLETIVASVESEIGPLKGVVAAAGLTLPAPSTELPLNDWIKVLSINLTGSFLTARVAAKRMLDREAGSIVLLGSTAALGGVPGRANYTASKYGVLGLAKALAIEWGRQGVRVNVVSPGPVDTPMFRAVNSTEDVANTYLPKIPVGRLAEAVDEARSIVYLLSDYSAYITGTNVPVDGGLTAGYVTHISD